MSEATTVSQPPPGTPGRIFRLLTQGAPRQSVVAVLLAVVLSLTEGIGLALIFPAVALLGDPARTAPPGSRTAHLFAWLAATGLPRAAWLPCTLAALVLALGLLAQLNALVTELNHEVRLRVLERLAAEVYNAILRADWTWLTGRRAASLTHALTSEVDRVGLLCGTGVTQLANALVCLLMIAVALTLAPGLTLLLLACFAALLPLERRSARALYRAGTETGERVRAVFDASIDRLGNLKVIKAFSAEQTEHQLFTTRYGAVLDQMLSLERRRTAAGRVFQIVPLVAVCAVLLVGLLRMHLPVSTMLAFLLAFTRLTPRFSALQRGLAEMASELPALDALDRFLADCAAHTSQPLALADDPPRLRHALTLAGVGFRYGAEHVLDGVTLTLAAGSMTALAGLSGAGKSTAADLILGLLAPSAGSIAVDGRTLDDGNRAAWHRHVGYVSQDTVLFHDTIRANLLWASPQATPEELAQALREARADFVETLPEGLGTVVGDRGVRLSHGQRQRLSLARALLLAPDLLILDEATNSLDLDNEEGILRTVLEGRRTVLLISHRPSALRFADHVYVLERGCIAAEGAWETVRERVEGRGSTDSPEV